MEFKELEIEGMTCDHCAAKLTAALEGAGGSEVRVSHERGSAHLDPQGLSDAALEETVQEAGYRVTEIRDVTGGPKDLQDDGAGPALSGDGRGRGHEYDYLVIGSGSGAFASAIRARDLGNSVLMVERNTTGGTCVNVGCIPSKSLLASSEYAALRAMSLAAAVERKDELVAKLRQSKYVDLLDEYGIKFRRGEATLTGPNSVEVDGQTLTADAILIAAGAQPAVPSIPGLEEAGYLTSTTALELTEPPQRLAVIGSNAVGLELGQAFGNFGSKVTLIARRTVAPYAEPEISEELRELLEVEGHTVLERAVTESVELESDEKVLRGRLNSGESFEVRADDILVATGRKPNTAGVGLERIGVDVDGTGAIIVDSEQRTSVPSVFAAGDITTQPRYVYVAATGGAVAAENALSGGHRKLNFDALPRIIFTTPTVATAGLTEAEAGKRGIAVETTVLTLDAVPRALVDDDTRGLFKLVADAESRQLVGASVLADGAGDVIQSAVFAIERGMTVEEIASTWAPYLTMAEGLKLAAQTFGRDVAKLSCCAA